VLDRVRSAAASGRRLGHPPPPIAARRCDRVGAWDPGYRDGVVTLELPFGDRTLRVQTGAQVHRLEPPHLGSPLTAVADLLDAALDAPIGSPRLEDRVRAGDRVTLIVSDATRAEPRAALVAAVRRRLPAVRLTLAVATGTHGPSGGLAHLGIPDELVAGAAVVDHDGHDARDLVDVGTTARGTAVRVHRAAVEADLVVATGVIRPHYFAGWGAGAKAIFPGLASATSARQNHRWKEHPSARAGVIDDNVCRLDLEEAARLAAPRAFLLDGVADADEQVRAAVAGDVDAAFRRGAALAAPWFGVRAPARSASLIVVADRLPVTSSLYQASKCVAAVAPLLAPGGTVVVVAPCASGIGPVDVVNQAIYEIGLRPRLPADHRIVLVSTLDEATVRPSYATWCPTVEDAIAGARELLVAPRASKLVLDVVDR